ncbi:alpha/beta fold hydrolase [Flavobacterium rakeshii]|uniref:Alpha/beta fold hydrolase n=1 Tax=Flavobacterium rakeshii TaxID=1038845 RepID=A0A6N8HIA7_9FLAO|nr:alpha/beta hydrolase [Flavobacterium rakeshii]MUV05475.1 alpha/beta fold hydrolase [Flavobacterium rakeshii]
MKHIHYKNSTVSYTDTGDGPALVLLHGFLENSNMWKHYITEFSKHYRVITVDLLGHGQTDCIGYIHTMEDMADAVYAVLEDLGITEAVFTGHSMGGYVALAIAELYPDAVKGIVLQNSTSKADSEERKLNRDRAINAVKQSYANFVRLAIANLFSEENRERLTAEIESVRNEALKTPVQGIVAALEGMKIRKDREVLLHTTDIPVLLILGKKDPVMNYQDSLSQLDDTNVKLITYPDGHMAHIENRETLTADLLQFYKAIL